MQGLFFGFSFFLNWLRNSTVSHFVLDRTRTLVEHSGPTERERAMAWAKDIMAGIGLVAFITCSFALANIAQAALS
jgi:predicted HAD superfamily phosphohydrolase YqeG